MEDIDVMICDPFYVNLQIFSFWVHGYSIQEAAQAMQQEGVLEQFENSSIATLISDVCYQYSFFHLVEKQLHDPVTFATSGTLQCVFSIDDNIKRSMIHMYYEINALVVRQFIGKKLTAKERRDLEELSQETGIPRDCCRRQFDNIRRVYKRVEELASGLLEEHIRNLFLLPKHLSSQYAAVIFLTNNHLDASKKKLSYLTFADLVICATEMISYWSCEYNASRSGELSASLNKSFKTPDSFCCLDLDHVFFQDLKELRYFNEKEVLDEMKSLMSLNLSGKMSSERAFLDMENNFKMFFKTIITMSGGLSHAREAKDLFIDIVEKMIEPIRLLNWSPNDLQVFLTALKSSGNKVLSNQKKMSLRLLWDRFTIPFCKMILTMFHM